MKKYITTIFVSLLIVRMLGSTIPHADKQFFIENKGQWNSDVLFLCRMGGLDAWITKYGVNYTFYEIKREPFVFDYDVKDETNEVISGQRVLFQFLGANNYPTAEGTKKLPAYYNYLIGDNHEKYATQVGLYKEVFVKNIYEGIDLKYYFDNAQLRFDFIVNPNSDPSQISFKLLGTEKTMLKSNSSLAFQTILGNVELKDLKTIQNGKLINCGFTKKGDNWGIKLDRYNRNQKIIIDPLIYSTYIGASSDDIGYAIAVDASGNAFFTGTTMSSNYSITPGVFQTNKGLYEDVFVTKMNPAGNGLIYSTFIGGSAIDIGYGIAIDNNGNAYITGKTASLNFPKTTGAFQTTLSNSFHDAFITKLNPTGTALVYSTYLGGTNEDIGYSIAVNPNGEALVAGSTKSTNFDTTAASFQTTIGGAMDVFITKINQNGNSLIYSTYLGGTGDDAGQSIAIDANDNAYITGYAASNFDITPGAYQTNYLGGNDVFVTKLNPQGNALIYSTYIGGYSDDQGKGIAVDAAGNAYVAGQTASSSFPTTSGVIQASYGGGPSDAFVLKLNSTGTGLIYSTYLGGSNREYGYGIALDNNLCASITGYGYSNNYPLSSNADQTTTDPTWQEIIITKVNSNASALIYSSYLGGNGGDEGMAIAVDANNDIYITGRTWSTNFDVTPGAFQTTGGASFALYDAFVTKIGTNSNAINAIQDNNSIRVFPNPNNGRFTILTEKEALFELMDCSGKMINTYTGKGNLEIHEKLNPGIYFIREINTGLVQKIIITN